MDATPAETTKTAKQSAKQLAAARSLIAEIAGALDLDASVRLWDGSVVPLGSDVKSPLDSHHREPRRGRLALRWPTLDRLIRLYAKGRIGLEGGTLIDLGLQLQQGSTRKRLKNLGKLRVAKLLLPFLFAPADKPGRSRDYRGDETGRGARAKQRTATSSSSTTTSPTISTGSSSIRTCNIPAPISPHGPARSNRRNTTSSR